MAVFPCFIDLRDKQCVVIGGGTVAQRKIERLLEFCAEIVVISLSANEKIRDLHRDGRIDIKIKEYNSQDLDGAFLVIAAVNNEKTNEKIYHDALKKGILINVVDCPEKCGIIFPSIIKRGDMVIGISTSGEYPALSKRIRQKLDNLFPVDFGSVVEILREYRIKAKKMIKNQEERTLFLTRIINDVLDTNLTTIEEFRTFAEDIFKEYTDEKDY